MRASLCRSCPRWVRAFADRARDGCGPASAALLLSAAGAGGDTPPAASAFVLSAAPGAPPGGGGCPRVSLAPVAVLEPVRPEARTVEGEAFPGVAARRATAAGAPGSALRGALRIAFPRCFFLFLPSSFPFFLSSALQVRWLGPADVAGPPRVPCRRGVVAGLRCAQPPPLESTTITCAIRLIELSANRGAAAHRGASTREGTRTPPEAPERPSPLSALRDPALPGCRGLCGKRNLRHQVTPPERSLTERAVPAVAFAMGAPRRVRCGVCRRSPPLFLKSAIIPL
eukprot:gene12190-biopygen3867